jgi:hypothetical protein
LSHPDRQVWTSDKGNYSCAIFAWLNEAREHLKLAEALGYGNKKDYKKFYAEIDEIEEKTECSKSGKGLFAEVKEHLVNFRRSIFG